MTASDRAVISRPPRRREETSSQTATQSSRRRLKITFLINSFLSPLEPAKPSWHTEPAMPRYHRGAANPEPKAMPIGVGEALGASPVSQFK